MESLRPPTGGGQPSRIDDAAQEAIRATALACPVDLGEPSTRWSLATLRRYLIGHRVVAGLSKKHLRRLLNRMGLGQQYDVGTIWKARAPNLQRSSMDAGTSSPRSFPPRLTSRFTA